MPDLPRFMCGHLSGEEPVTDKDKGPLCGTLIHWSRFEGVPANSDEVRVTSATGGQKGRKQAQLGAIDPTALRTVAEVAGHGTEKYARYNFLRGYDWSLSYDALQRHLLAFWAGEDIDPESGLAHLGHAAWHCLALLAFMQRQIGTDDRPQVGPAPMTPMEELAWSLTKRAQIIVSGDSRAICTDPNCGVTDHRPKRRMPCCDFAEKQGEKVAKEHAEAHEA